MAVVSAEGRLQQLSPGGLSLFERYAWLLEGEALQREFWKAVVDAAPSEIISWRGGGDRDLSCFWVRLQAESRLLVFLRSEEERDELSRGLYRRQLDWTAQTLGHLTRQLRAPATTLLYSADLLAILGEKNRELADAASEILSAAEELSSILSRLLDFERLKTDATEQIPVSALVSAAEQEVRGILRQQNAHVRFQVPVEQSQLQIVGPVPILSRILGELLENAARSVPGVTITVSAEVLEQSQAQVALSVQDDGPGILEGLEAQLFHPFVSGRRGSLGLGLSLARVAARDLGGDLSLTPSSRGACFVLTLPRGTFSTEKEG